MNCPNCGYDVKIYTTGIWAGLWECQNAECGMSDTHEHNFMLTPDGDDLCLECGEVAPVPEFVPFDERLRHTLRPACGRVLS